MHTSNNRSGTTHNIISHDLNLHSGVVSKSALGTYSTTQQAYQAKPVKFSHHKLKSITEIRDLVHPSAVNKTEGHDSAIKAEANTFARKDGIFTHLYNSAARIKEPAFKI